MNSVSVTSTFLPFLALWDRCYSPAPAPLHPPLRSLGSPYLKYEVHPPPTNDFLTVSQKCPAATTPEPQTDLPPALFKNVAQFRLASERAPPTYKCNSTCLHRPNHHSPLSLSQLSICEPSKRLTAAPLLLKSNLFSSAGNLPFLARPRFSHSVHC